MNRQTESRTQTSLIYQQARLHQQNDDIGEAVAQYGQVLAAQPRHLPALLHLGEIAWKTGNLEQAIVLLNRAVSIDPRFVEAYDLLWQVRRSRGDLDGAIHILQRQLELRRHDGISYYNLGLLLRERGRLAEAGEMFEDALRWKADDAKIHASRGDLMEQLEKWEEAVSSYRRATLLESRNPGYLMKLSKLLVKQGQLVEAHTHIERASLLDPANDTIRRIRWQLLLKQGCLREGFAEAEARFQMKELRPSYGLYTGIPRWHGEQFSGRLLIHPETSPEDILQFARYLPQVKEKAGTLILALPRPMMRLFTDMGCVDEIVENTAEGILTARADLTASILSLPALFDTTMETIPSRTPYFFVDPFLTHSWVRKLNRKTFRVGLVWAVNEPAGAGKVAERSTNLNMLEPLLNIPDVSWYSLQNETGLSVDLLNSQLPISDCAAGLRDYADTAALTANMDLVIAVDSPQAHLAAAIGRPVWTLLPYEASWRWLHNRGDSPWYPTMRLFRQTRPGDWEGVIRQVAEALAPSVRPLRKFQPLQGVPAAFFAETAVPY